MLYVVVFLLCSICFSFFCKQKTAYEMRISDWSSDVCSSDLNVIPASARGRLLIRHNDQHKGADLVAMIERIAHEVEPNAKILGKISGEAFLTPLGELSELVADAIHAETDARPEMSTTGGTSDARFLQDRKSTRLNSSH